MAILAGAEPFHADGGPIGVLMGHGFTGSPLSIRPWAQHLASEGFTVSAPLFPGHGTHWQDLETTRWTDWYNALERAHHELAQRCTQIFGFGLSMGAGLTLRLAQVKPTAFSGMVLVNPSVGSNKFGPKLLSRFPLLSRIVRTSTGIGGDIKKPGGPETSYDRVPVRAAYELTKMWAAVSADLDKITAPTLLYKSQIDHIVDGRSLELIRAGLTNAPLEVTTLNNDASTIFAGSTTWISQHRHQP